MARFVMTGEKSWYLERLPLSRFADLDKVVAEAQASKLQR
jgi:hypothetical protein